MSELPEQFVINSITYQLKQVDTLFHDDGDKCNGLYDEDEQTVSLLNGRPHQATRITLLHEISHIIEEHAGLDLKEKTIDSMGRSIFSLIVNNPELIAWIQERKQIRRFRPVETTSTQVLTASEGQAPEQAVQTEKPSSGSL